MAKAILIQGGTFDPVHNGHLRTALDVAKLLGVEEIRLIPCGDPPHRAAPGATADQRLRMLRSAVLGQSEFIIDERELHRQGPSYMVDTAASLRAELGDEVPICLMMGMDAFLGLPQWHEWERLFESISVVVTQRPGEIAPEQIANEALQHLMAERRVASVDALLKAPSGKLLFVPVTQLDISATQIRGMVAGGESPRYLLPDGVLQIIESEKLYRTEIE